MLLSVGARRWPHHVDIDVVGPCWLHVQVMAINGPLRQGLERDFLSLLGVSPETVHRRLVESRNFRVALEAADRNGGVLCDSLDVDGFLDEPLLNAFLKQIEAEALVEHDA